MHLNYRPIFCCHSEAAWWFWVWRGGEEWWYHCGFVVGRVLNACLLACRWGLTKTVLLLGGCWMLACHVADKDRVVAVQGAHFSEASWHHRGGDWRTRGTKGRGNRSHCGRLPQVQGLDSPHVRLWSQDSHLPLLRSPAQLLQEDDGREHQHIQQHIHQPSHGAADCLQSIR